MEYFDIRNLFEISNTNDKYLAYKLFIELKIPEAQLGNYILRCNLNPKDDCIHISKYKAERFMDEEFLYGIIIPIDKWYHDVREILRNYIKDYNT